MYRQIFTPTEHNSIIPVTIPREWYGQTVEIIAFPVSAPVESRKKNNDEDFMKLCGAWESDKSAEELVAEIRAARKFRERELALCKILVTDNENHLNRLTNIKIENWVKR